MYIVNSYGLAVFFCFVIMLCWGSWGNTQKLAAKSWIDIRTELIEFIVSKQIVRHDTTTKRNPIIHVEFMLGTVLTGCKKRRTKNYE